MERTQTIRDFMMQCECFEYSQEHYDLMKEAMEADLMDQFIQNQLFISENVDSINTPDGYMFTEGCFMESTSEDNLIAIYEKKEEKEQNIFQKIWAGIKNIFSKIGNFFKRLFGAGKDYKKMYEDLKEKSKDLEERLDETVKKLAKKKQAAQDAGKLVNDKNKEIKKLEEENKKLKEQRDEARNNLESQKKNTKKLKRNLNDVRNELSDVKSGKNFKGKDYLGILVGAFIKNPNIDIYGTYMELIYNDILKPAYDRANFPVGRLADIEYKLTTIVDPKKPALNPNAKIDPKVRTLYNLAFAEKIRFKLSKLPDNLYIMNYGDIKTIYNECSKFMDKFTSLNNQTDQKNLNENKIESIIKLCFKFRTETIEKGLAIKSLYSNGDITSFNKHINTMQQTQSDLSNKNITNNQNTIKSNSNMDKADTKNLNATLVNIYTSINKSIALLIPLYRQYDMYIREVVSQLSGIDAELRKVMNYDAEKNQGNKKKEKNSKYDFSGDDISDAESSQKEAEQVLADSMKEMRDEAVKNGNVKHASDM